MTNNGPGAPHPPFCHCSICEYDPTPAEYLEDYKHLLVRRAVQRDDAVSEAIFTLADDKKEWTLEEWNTLLADLDKCDLTIGEWLVLYT